MAAYAAGLFLAIVSAFSTVACGISATGVGWHRAHTVWLICSGVGVTLGAYLLGVAS